MTLNIIVGKTSDGWGAYAPDLDAAIIALGETREEAIQDCRNALLDIFDLFAEKKAEPCLISQSWKSARPARLRRWKRWQRHNNVSKRKCWTIWIACATVVGIVVLFVCRFLLFGLPVDVHDTVILSPDGTYTATLHNVDAGAAGSYSQALLRRTDDSGKDAILVDGGYEFVNKVEWGNGDTLTVTTGLEGRPDPSWPKSWQGVKIKYKW